jgi:ABC-type branched-subunit amino acid transport system ATPase component
VLTTLTVEQNLRVARADKRYVLELFPELADHLGRKVGLLSGGQQQMLALGQALGRRPDALLSDELSLGLAPIIVDRLLQAVRAAANEGLAVLLVEQHVHKAMHVADRVYVLRRGRVRLSGTVEELRGRVDEIQSSYLDAEQPDAS